jgi:hypothetical protein
MKTKTVILAFSLVLFALNSCDFEKYPADKLNPNAFFTTEQELQIYCNSFYEMLPKGEDIFMNDGKMSDYFATSSTPPLLIYGNYTPLESELLSWWQWSELRNINYFLEKNINEEIPQDVRAHYNGVARLFRAWFYYNKVKTFGDVPWYDKVLSTSDADLYKERDSRTYVMDKVLDDLNYAVENLRTTKNSTSTAITKWVALALKSRICLFEGTFRKYSGENDLASSASKFLNEAAQSALMLINESGYSLNKSGSTPYRDLFTKESPVTTEVILADVYSNALSRFHSANWLWTSSSTGSRPGLTRTFVNTFLNLDGSRFTDNPDYNNIQFTEEVAGRDLRLKQIIRTPGYTLLGLATPPDLGHARTGYHFIKYTQDDNPNLAMGKNTNTLPILRYAEVLLNYAEAVAELGQMNDNIWETTIAALRNRAGITNTSRPSSSDSYMAMLFPGVSDADILEIRRERGVEMVGEGLRFDDLRRWRAGHLLERVWDGIYIPAINTLYDMNGDGLNDVCFVNQKPSNPVAGVYYYILSPSSSLSEGSSGNLLVYGNITKNFSENKYLYPIPEPERLINPQLAQNPGWTL